MGLFNTAPASNIFTEQALMPLNPGYQKDRLQSQIDASTQFGRGWEAAGIGEDANSLMTKAFNAYRSGDDQLGSTLEQQARDLHAQAQQWAPTVKEFTDINGPGSALDWGLGAMGNLRSSAMPFIGGVGGAAVGALAGGALGALGMGAGALPGAAVGANWGARAGSALLGGKTEYEEAIGNAMMDPEIRANKSWDDIHNAALVKGGINSVLEGAVPGALSKSLLLGGGKEVAENVAKQGLKKAGAKEIGKDVAKEYAEEALTEGTQSLVGQAAENHLKDKSLTDFDYQQALNEAMAGGMAGAGMGGIGGAAKVARAGLGATGEKVADVVADPVGKALDKVYENSAEKGAEDAKAALAAKQAKYAGMDPDEAAAMEYASTDDHEGQLRAGLSRSETGLDDSVVSAGRKAMADKTAESILGNEANESEERVAAAKAYLEHKDWHKFRSDLNTHGEQQKRADLDSSIEETLPKKSKMNMTEQGKVTSALAEHWLNRDGKTHPLFQKAGPDEKKTATLLMEWVRSGFGAEHNNGEVMIPHKLVEALGDKAQKIVGSMADLAEKQGIASFTKGQKAQVLNELRDSAMANNTDHGVVENLLKPLADANWTTAKTANLVNVLRQKKGKVSDAMKKALDESFVDVDKLLKHFSDKEQGAVAKEYMKRDKISDGTVTPSAGESDEASFEEKQSAQNELGTTDKSRYFSLTKGGDDYFDTRNPEHVAQLDALKAEHTQANDPMDATPKAHKLVGAFDRELEKAVGGGALGDAHHQTVERIKRELIEKFTGEKVRPPKKEGDSKMAVAKYNREKEAYDAQVSKLIRDINSRYKVLRVDDVQSKKDDIAFDKADIAALRSTRDITKPTNSTQANGTLVLEQTNAEGAVTKKPFVTSTLAIMRKMFQVKDGSDQSTSSHINAHDLFDKLMSGLASVMQDPRFTGRVGYIDNAGKTVWMDTAQLLPSGALIYEKLYKTVSHANMQAYRDDPTVSIEETAGSKDKPEAKKQYNIYKRVTVADAKMQADEHRRADSADSEYKIKYAEGALDKAEAIEEFVNREVDGKPLFSKAKAQAIIDDLNETGDIERIYEKLKGGAEAYGDVEGSENEQPKKARKAWFKEHLDRVNEIVTAKDEKGQYKVPPQQRKVFFEAKAAYYKERSAENKAALQAIMEQYVPQMKVEDRAKVSREENLVPSENTRFEPGDERGSLAQDPASMLGKDSKFDREKYELGENLTAVAANAAGNHAVVKPGAEKGPLATKTAGEKKNNFTLPADDDLHNVMEETAKNLTVHRLTVDERRVAKAAWMELARRGFGNSLNQVGHVLSFTQSEHSGLMMGGGWAGGKTVIGLNKNVFTTLKNHLFDSLGQQIRYILSHEVGHTIDIGVDKTNPGNFSTHPDFKMGENGAEGSVAKEMEAAALNVNNPFQELLGHTPFKPEYNGKPVAAQRELFAQAFAMYAERKEEMREHLPLTFKHMEALNGRGYTVQQGTETNTGTSGAKQVENSSVQEGNNNGGSAEAGVQAGQRAVGAEPSGGPAGELQRHLDAHGSKDAAWKNSASKAIAENNTKQITGALNYAKRKFGEVKQSAQRADSQNASGGTQTASAEAQQAAKDHILKTCGPDTQTAFINAFSDGSTATFHESAMGDIVTLALNNTDEAMLSGAAHESMHKFFSILRKHGGEKTQALLERLAMSKPIQNQLRRLLNKHPEALAQLSNPEEAVAYMYQFAYAGQLRIGPEAKTLFQKVADFLKTILGFVSESIRQKNEAAKRDSMERIAARDVLNAFNDGLVADPAVRQAAVEALEKNVEAHEAALKRVGEGYRAMVNMAGKLVMSAEAVMDATGNEHIVKIARMFHQKAGAAMGERSGFSDGLRQQTSLWMNKLENLLMQHDKEDLELARQELAAGTPLGKITDPVVKGIVKDIRDYFKEMAQYMGEKDVRRLNFDRTDQYGQFGVWEKIDLRDNYFPQVFDQDYVMAHKDEFVADLIKHHYAELERIAQDANREVQRQKPHGKNSASATAMANNNAIVTPEEIAEAIAQRIMGNGKIDLEETESQLGMTPVSMSVNRRAIDWLDPKEFDKYKSKDIANIMSTYTRNMVKRGEYQSRFGYGGETLRDLADKAVLHELGGQALIDKAEAALEQAKLAWAASSKTEPFPTLRSVGQQLHKAELNDDAKYLKGLESAMAKLNQSFKAVQAMEGTLGNDITPAQRTINSALVTYQNFRLLSMMLFTSFADVAGIVVNGGEMKDAWNAFVSGIREIKSTWANEKNDSDLMRRAEEWGAVDAGSFLDSLGQAYGGTFMTGRAKRMSDAFFKWTGAEGWNRGIRAVAASVAERTILNWKENGLNAKDKAEVARFKRLFGKDAKPEDIKLDDQGRLDITDPANQAAVTRWILDAVPAPTAAHRPVWGSDPRFQAFMHLKNYTYTFHRVMLNGVVDQAKLGNYRPALAALAGYIPIMIAGGAIKEMLIPGDEPPWMKGGLDGYLSYGWQRAGVLGVPQMYGEALFDFDPAKLLGPSVDQVQGIMSIPLMESHSLLGEGLGSLPLGNLARRVAE